MIRPTLILLSALLAGCTTTQPLPAGSPVMPVAEANCAIMGLDNAYSGQYQTIDSFQPVADLLFDFSLPAATTLVVFDIDDTLLESINFVGSDAWYRWQTWSAGKPPVYSPSGGRIEIAADQKFTCLYEALSTLYGYGVYQPTEESVPAIVSKAAATYDLILLTSRSPYYRGATERELQRSIYAGLPDEQLLEDQTAVYAFVLGGRQVSYQNGIVMSTGAPKGEVLEQVLNEINVRNKTDKKYDNIVFVDDGHKNIVDMLKVWNDKEGVDLHAFFYTRVNKCISDQDIETSMLAKRNFDEFLESSFPDGYQDFILNGCRY